MIKSLTIRNYALIEQLEVSFDAGLTTITGETGAGKSLLLGALGLLLGKRADLNSIRDKDKKCAIEGVYNIKNYNLTSVFEKEDLDYEEETIIRREILPSGKSRAFINDTPVTLQSLQTIGSYLIDIHSQHQTMAVTTNTFQMQVLDALASNEKILTSYKRGLVILKNKEKEKLQLEANKSEFVKEYDYNSFLLKELDEAKLKENEQTELEEQIETLSNVEEIRERLTTSLAITSNEEVGVLDMLNTVKANLTKIESYSADFQELSTRLQSAYLELEDITENISEAVEKLDADPQQLEQLNDRLQFIHNLHLKHTTGTVSELLIIQKELQEKVSKTDSLDEEIGILEKEIIKIKGQLNQVAEKLHVRRSKALPKLTKELEKLLSGLGMPNARFKASITLNDSYGDSGKDTLEFLFSANKGGNFDELKKVASGGELSRIMIAIKAVLSNYQKLPTIIFDEIDTGVSGEVAQKMADMMMDMSKNLQVFSITHLPQIAANGQHQFKVYKEDINNVTVTQLRLLNQEDRIKEIAEMIGGKDISESALTHAKALLLAH
ncbi:DNA repair protein RecN [Aquimarina sp. ERC-38]|uniref:DNA repair protein RecN n=1 Tax=Aquimarina sp. ERC-38 TaxID=2949996 RepID=UPI002247DD84|nr:DNA repair protein RecN [Aquimarina sp. ERC-38]UZO79370.1 DNA repair protein RecN [Aquimarina sp. ERC-38]